MFAPIKGKNRRRRALRLFYWPSVDALANAYPGRAFALTTSKAMAIKLISERRRNQFSEEYHRLIKGYIEKHLAELVGELQAKEPEIYDGHVGFAMDGSQ